MIGSNTSFFDNIASYFSEIYPDEVKEDTIVAKKLLTKIKLPPQSNVLDIGCGNGAFIAALKRQNRGFKCHGMDVSKEFIRIAKEHYAGIVTFFRGNFLDISNYPNKKFELITLIGNSLSHYPEKYHDRLFSIIKSKIENNGFFIVDVYTDWDKIASPNEVSLNPRGAMIGRSRLRTYLFVDRMQRKVLERRVIRLDYNIRDGKAYCVRKSGHDILQYKISPNEIKRHLTKAGFNKISMLKSIDKGITHIIAQNHE